MSPPPTSCRRSHPPWARVAREQLDRWWARLQADVFLVSYPRSGSRRLRELIGAALVPGAREPWRLERLTEVNGALPRFRCTHEGVPTTLGEVSGELRDKRSFRDRPVMLLSRDPRDLAVAWYDALRYPGTLGSFLREPHGGIGSMADYLLAWQEGWRTAGRFVLVRYEDLHRDANGELRRILDFLGLDVSAGFTATWGGHVGEHRERMSAADLAYANAVLAARPLDFFGYLPDQ